MPLDDPNVGLAFGLTVAAGAATAVGAAVVFVPRLVKLASRRTLAGALALSAGVMTYVSFVEILGKSRLKFLEAGYADNVAYMYATVCFFGGVVFMTVRCSCFVGSASVRDVACRRGAVLDRSDALCLAT
jgi:zinc transporter, ZIP family